MKVKFLRFRNDRERTTTRITQQLAILLHADIPLTHALTLLATQQAEPSWEQLLLQLKYRVEAGTPLNQALQDHPQLFNPLYRSLVHIGEATSTLAQQLQQLAQYRETLAGFKQQLKKACFYPCMVMITACVVMLLQLLFIAPRFAELLADFGKSPPATTQHLLQFAQFLQEYIWQLMISMIVLAGSVYRYRHHPQLRALLENIGLKTPGLRSFLIDYGCFMACHTLFTALSAKLPLSQAMQLTQHTHPLSYYRYTLAEAEQQLRLGVSMFDALQRYSLYSPFMLQFVMIGEASAKLSVMLDHAGQHHRRQLQEKLHRISTMVEPITMAIVGVFTGWLLLALYLPLFELGKVF